MQNRPIRIRLLILTVAVLATVAPASWFIWNLRTDDHPARTYWRYSSRLAQYAERLQAGRVAIDSNGEYAIPQFLIDRGARHVFREGTCYVITFGFLPTDAVPELWFSPSGFDPLPKAIDERRHRAYFQFSRLNREWAECYWDQ